MRASPQPGPRNAWIGNAHHRNCMVEVCTWSFYHLPSSFFLITVFFGVHFYGQTPGTYLHHTVSMVGVTGSRHFWGLAGVWFLFYLNLYENIYMFTFKKKHFLERPLQDLRPDLES